jgi:hypothetical protein
LAVDEKWSPDTISAVVPMTDALPFYSSRRNRGSKKEVSIHLFTGHFSEFDMGSDNTTTSV